MATTTPPVAKRTIIWKAAIVDAGELERVVIGLLHLAEEP